MHELLELQVGDDPDAWRSAGFVVDDQAAVVIGRVRVVLTGDQAKRGIRSWAFHGIPEMLAGLDGLATVAASGVDPEPTDHPNGCVAIDHVVILSPDSTRTVGVFADAGFEPRRERETDQYGLSMRQTFFRSGDVIIELIAPIDASGDGPAKFFGLAHTVADMNATAALLADHLGEVKQAVQPGRLITTLRHQPLGMSVATAFMSPDPDQ